MFEKDQAELAAVLFCKENVSSEANDDMYHKGGSYNSNHKSNFKMKVVTTAKSQFDSICIFKQKS